jgi:hypothetical protein
MSGWAKFSYRTVRWRPPQLTAVAEIAVGEEVHRLGKDNLKKEFLAGLSSAAEEPSRHTPKGKASAVVVAGLSIAGVAVFAPGILVAGATAGLYAGGMYYGSRRLALWRFNRWLDRCLASYLDSEKPRLIENEIIACRQCGQRLRIPVGKGRLKITCPKCGSAFSTP